MKEILPNIMRLNILGMIGRKEEKKRKKGKEKKRKKSFSPSSSLLPLGSILLRTVSPYLGTKKGPNSGYMLIVLPAVPSLRKRQIQSLKVKLDIKMKRLSPPKSHIEKASLEKNSIYFLILVW